MTDYDIRINKLFYVTPYPDGNEREARGIFSWGEGFFINKQPDITIHDGEFQDDLYDVWVVNTSGDTLNIYVVRGCGKHEFVVDGHQYTTLLDAYRESDC